MHYGIYYLRPGKRRPVRMGLCLDPDIQGRLPLWWCPGCGREVFEKESLYCPRCR